MARSKYKAPQAWSEKCALVLTEEPLEEGRSRLCASLLLPGCGANFYDVGFTGLLLKIVHELRQTTPPDQLRARAGFLIASRLSLFFGRAFRNAIVDESCLSPLAGVEVIDEIDALRAAVSCWLDERQAPDLINSISLSAIPPDAPDRSILLAGYCCYRRLRQAPAYPADLSYRPVKETDKDGKVLSWCNRTERLARIHESDSLLALAWAEIWYAFDAQLRMRVCPYCWMVFRVPPEYPAKHHCGSRECKKAYEIERHGGIDAYRTYETARHKRKSGKPPGRQPKHQVSEKRKLAGKIQVCLRGMRKRGRLSPDEYSRLYVLVDEMVEAGSQEDEIRKAVGLNAQGRKHPPIR